MKDKFLALGFREVGHFVKNNSSNYELIRVHVDYNPSNIVWAVLTDSEVIYVGETIDEINKVIKDLEKGNKNRATRNNIHLLMGEYLNKTNVYLFVDESGVNLKEDLIKNFVPIGNKNGK